MYVFLGEYTLIWSKLLICLCSYVKRNFSCTETTASSCLWLWICCMILRMILQIVLLCHSYLMSKACVFSATSSAASLGAGWGDHVTAWQSNKKPSHLFFLLYSTGMFLALSTLGRLVLLAPLPETQLTLDIKDMEVMRSSEFQDNAENAYSLVTKILMEIPAVHKSLIHTEVRSGQNCCEAWVLSVCADTSILVPTSCLNTFKNNSSSFFLYRHCL